MPSACAVVDGSASPRFRSNCAVTALARIAPAASTRRSAAYVATKILAEQAAMTRTGSTKTHHTPQQTSCSRIRFAVSQQHLRRAMSIGERAHRRRAGRAEALLDLGIVVGSGDACT